MPTSQSKRWTDAERIEIREYARRHPTVGWRSIQRWFMSQHPGKRLTHSQLNKILNAEEPRLPSDGSSSLRRRRPEPAQPARPEMEYTGLGTVLWEWLRVVWRRRILVYCLCCMFYLIFYFADSKLDLRWVMVVDEWIIILTLGLIIHALLLIFL